MPKNGLKPKRMKGLEPSTFCMASRRSSQLSYIRVRAEYSDARCGPTGSDDAAAGNPLMRGTKPRCARRGLVIHYG